jgi:hypothetical protein
MPRQSKVTFGKYTARKRSLYKFIRAELCIAYLRIGKMLLNIYRALVQAKTPLENEHLAMPISARKREITPVPGKATRAARFNE